MQPQHTWYPINLFYQRFASSLLSPLFNDTFAESANVDGGTLFCRPHRLRPCEHLRPHRQPRSRRWSCSHRRWRSRRQSAVSLTVRSYRAPRCTTAEDGAAPALLRETDRYLRNRKIRQQGATSANGRSPSLDGRPWLM